MKRLDIDGLVEKLQKEIEYCITCQSYDGGEVVWIWGERTDLEELFDQFRIPENLRDEIAEKLRCPNCGCYFERGADYGKKSESEKNREQLLDRQYANWIKAYTPKLKDFDLFIKKYPYLGASHKLGAKIIKTISKFPKKEIKDESWFRARAISDGRVFSHKDMTAPNPKKHKIPEGRFNHYGQSHFYLAETKICAAKETLAFSDEKMVWVQEIVIRQAKAILDVRAGFEEADPDFPILATGLIHFSNVLNSTVKRDGHWKPEYFVPRFISDAAKFAGFKGILYNSNHHHSDNLVIFNASKIEYEFKNAPSIFTISEESYSIFPKSPPYIPQEDDM